MLDKLVRGAYRAPSFRTCRQRVERQESTGDFVEMAYDAQGRLIGTRARQAWWEEIFVSLGSRPLVKYQWWRSFFPHPNHLGSTTQVSDESGAVISDELFYPWGQRWASQGTLYDERFASLGPRDPLWPGQPEGLLDFTPNRTYHSRLYRWLSPDPVAGDIFNPQSLNRYAYVLNNPVNFTDPPGLLLKPEEPLDPFERPDVWGDWGGYYVDGMPVSGSVFGTLAGMGAAVLWPYSYTSEVRITADNQLQGWVPPGQLTTTLTDEFGNVIGTYPGPVHPGYWTTVGTLGDTFNSFLRVTGNFSCGAADVLTWPVAQGAKALGVDASYAADSPVDTSSGAYLGGQIAGTGVAIGIAALGAANVAIGLESKVAIHGAHHTFEWLGGTRVAHIQITFWLARRQGLANWHIPLPWR